MTTTTSRSPRALSLLLTLVAALVLAACGSDGDSGNSDGDGTAGLPEVAIQTQNGFNAQEIYADASPGVVTIRSVFGGSGPLGAAAGQGSGFVINDEGEVVTNAHVITDGEAGGGEDVEVADEVFVEFGNRNQVKSEIVGFDLNADVALLKVDPDGLDLTPLEFEDSDEVPVGAPVAAIGSPFGQESSLSVGIVSATNRSIQSLTQFSINDAIQTDASINPGNSGGPLLDDEGRVIGVNQQINTTSGGNEGVGFAVPSNLVQRSIEDLRDDGEAEYAFIGVSTIPLYPQLADKLEIDAPFGTLITLITDGSPADKAGLKGSDGQTISFQGREIDVGGDVIVAIDGEDLVDETDVARLVTQKRPGEKIEVEVVRDGKREKFDVTLAARPERIEDIADPRDPEAP